MSTATATAKTRPRRSVLHKWQYQWIAAGLVLWIALMALRTGVGTFIALGNVLLLMGALVIVTIPTRTVTVMELLAPFSLGGSMVAWAVLAGWIFTLTFGTKAPAGRSFAIPLVEEILKLTPVLIILWRQGFRRGSFGATDILLLAAASGSAFYWVEEAFIIHNQHSWSSVGSFPTTDITINFVANHAIWTAISGLTIGISSLLPVARGGRLLIAVSGCLWSSLDHAFNNYNAHFHDAISRVLRLVSGNGYFSLYIFLAGVCFALVLDLYFLHFAPGKRPPVKFPRLPASWNQAKIALHYLRCRRRFAFASVRYRQATGKLQGHLALMGLALGISLRNLRSLRPLVDRKTG